MNWKYIVLHHSTKPDGETLEWSGIRKYHMSYRIDYHIVTKDNYFARLKIHDGNVFEEPYSDNGYNFGCEDIYGEYEVLVGRPLTRPGAHCKQKSMNTKSIGICFVGNYDLAKPDMNMILVCMNRIILPLCKIYDIGWNNIVGHREVTGVQKSCPGSQFDMDVVRELVRHELK